MICDLPERRLIDDRSDATTARRLSELLAACLGGQQADAWAVKTITRPKCRVLPFRPRVGREALGSARQSTADETTAG